MLDRSRMLLLSATLVLFAGCGEEQGPAAVTVDGSPTFSTGSAVEVPAEAIGADTAAVVRVELAPVTMQNIQQVVDPLTSEMDAEQKQGAQMMVGMFGGMLTQMSTQLQQAGAEAVVVALAPQEQGEPRGTILLATKEGSDAASVEQALKGIPQLQSPGMSVRDLGERYVAVQNEQAKLPESSDADRAATLSQALSMTEGGFLRVGFVMTEQLRQQMQQEIEQAPADDPMIDEGRALVAAMQGLQFGGATVGIEGGATVSALATFADAAAAEQFVTAWQGMLAGMREQAADAPAEKLDAAMSALALQQDGAVVSLKLDTEAMKALGALGTVKARAEMDDIEALDEIPAN